MNSATCVSPSKAFNLAGLQIADIVAADEQVRRRIDRAVNINEVCDVNPFGVAATVAGLRRKRGVARRPAKVFMGKLRIPPPLFRRTTAAIPRAAARRNLPGLDRLPGDRYRLGRYGPAFAERTETDGQFGHAVRPRRRRIHPAEYRLSPDAACRRTGTDGTCPGAPPGLNRPEII